MLSFPRLPRWNDILLEIYKSPEAKRYCEPLNRRVKGSRTHLREVVRMLEKHQLLRTEPFKNVKRLVLTDKGTRVALLLLEVNAELGPRDALRVLPSDRSALDGCP